MDFASKVEGLGCGKEPAGEQIVGKGSVGARKKKVGGEKSW